MFFGIVYLFNYLEKKNNQKNEEYDIAAIV